MQRLRHPRITARLEPVRRARGAIHAARVASPLRPTARWILDHAGVVQRLLRRIEGGIAPGGAERVGALPLRRAGGEIDVGAVRSVARDVEDLFARAEPTSRTLPALELRADPEGAWLAATGPLLAAVGDPGALPQTLLFDRGRLALLVQGPLDDDVAARFETHLAEAR